MGYLRIFDENGMQLSHIHGRYITPDVLGQGLGQKLMELMLTQRAQEPSNDQE
jgi:predicted GNAT family N-acyltransferase